MLDNYCEKRDEGSMGKNVQLMDGWMDGGMDGWMDEKKIVMDRFD